MNFFIAILSLTSCGLLVFGWQFSFRDMEPLNAVTVEQYNITVLELRKKKEKLDEAIKQLLRDFQNETGVAIENVYSGGENPIKDTIPPIVIKLSL